MQWTEEEEEGEKKRRSLESTYERCNHVYDTPSMKKKKDLTNQLHTIH